MKSIHTWIAIVTIGALGCAADAGSTSDEQALSTSTSTPVGTLLTTNDDLNLRAGASTSTQVVEVMPKGTRVTTLASSDVSGFRKVKVLGSGDVGYAYGAYLDVTGTVPSKSSAVAAPSWSCGSSSYQGSQYWTCDDGKSVYSCKDGTPKRISCSHGCIRLPAGNDDVCATSSSSSTQVALPSVNVIVHSGNFTQAQMTTSVRTGLTYEIPRINTYVPQSKGRALPAVTLEFWDSSDSYCSGITSTNHIDVYCPWGYPYSGDNQNYVENITMHELGHYLSRYLIADPGDHNNCVNEGAASWIAGKYWMNASSTYVGSLHAAADAASPYAVLSITSSCDIVGDNQYKVWASYLEYLQNNVSNGIYDVMVGNTSAGTYQQAWLNWL